jgi:hypothetical protein
VPLIMWLSGRMSVLNSGILLKVLTFTTGNAYALCLDLEAQTAFVFP